MGFAGNQKLWTRHRAGRHSPEIGGIHDGVWKHGHCQMQSRKRSDGMLFVSGLDVMAERVQLVELSGTITSGSD